MEIKFKLNGKNVVCETSPGAVALDLLRDLGCYSVKRGCDTSSCGLCSILVNQKSALSCSMPAPALLGAEVLTLEGLQDDARAIGSFLAAEGTEQCGYCSPGFIINVIAMKHELTDPSDEEILAYLAGNLCRCSGYQGQLRAIRAYLVGESPENTPSKGASHDA